MKQNILVMGAGAVGLTYGLKLTDGGAAVSFYVREKYRETMKAGSVLYDLSRDRQLNHPIHFRDYQVVCTFDEIRQMQWDQVYICFSSTAFRAFDWVGLKNSLTGTPTIVMLQPSADDYDLLARTFPADQIVEGMITLISYHAPLSTETADPPGTAYWFPPLMPTPFSGSVNRRDAVIRSFRAGGIRSKASESIRKDALFPSAFLGTFLTALEADDWSFEKLGADRPMLKKLQQAVDEVCRALSARYGVKVPFAIRAINRPMVFRLLLRLSPVVMPMDIETYFEAHFTKVKSQTRLYMQGYLEVAREEGTGHEMLEKFNTIT